MNATAFFNGAANEPVRASAPGRLDVMGGVADYSGSLVLQMPIRERTHAAVARRDDGILRVRSGTLDKEVTVDPEKRETLLGSDAASRRRDLDWAAYVIGAVMEFHQAIDREGTRSFEGLDIWVESEVPPGRGVSASAALEMAVLRALEKLWSVQVRPLDLAGIGQRAEHRWAAAPCGLMDQIASHCGVANHLLPILCRPKGNDPAQLSPPVPIPEGWHFVGIDSGVTHQVSGDAYGTARTAAFMGLAILSQKAEDWLTDISADHFEPESLPVTLRGEAFIEQFGSGFRDSVTKVYPTSNYPVRAAASHPIFEHQRIQRFLELLQTGEPEQAGALMYQSHQSYTDIGLGHPATDELVSTLRSHGPKQGIHGARVTGGGCGGTVCVLASEPGLETVRKIAGNRQLFLTNS